MPVLSKTQMGYQILIVDDEPDYLEATFELISNEYAQSKVLTAVNGKVAFEIASKKIPDLIITDWEMPLLDGLELIKQLKAQPSTADIPVIMATGIMTSPSSLKAALEAGAVDFVRKPIDPIELIARINSMLTLSAALNNLRSLNITKDRLFSIIAHDLKAPLNALHNMLEAFEMNLFSDEKDLKVTMSELGIGTQNVMGLLDNLLYWSNSQIKGESATLIPTALSIHDFLTEIKSLFKLTAQQKNVQITILASPELPKVWVDKNALRLVLRNLVSNAIKFSQVGGEVVLSAELEANAVCVVINDVGTGIEKDKLATLFHSVTSSTYGTSNEKGTGLGLVLSREFVNKSGGKIGVESVLGKGSTFWFTLPISSQ